MERFDDKNLKMELRALTWRESDYGNDATWVPKDVVPKDVKAALKKRGGRFYGEKFVYHLSSSGNVIRYWKSRKSDRYLPEPDERVQVRQNPTHSFLSRVRRAIRPPRP